MCSVFDKYLYFHTAKDEIIEKDRVLLLRLLAVATCLMMRWFWRIQLTVGSIGQTFKQAIVKLVRQAIA
jgi:hypothetical protein